MLNLVGFDDGAYCKFLYNGAGQVARITHYASDSNPANDSHPLNYTAYDYQTAADDVPRVAATRTWAENWTGINDVPFEVATQYAAPGDGSHTVTSPDGTVYKEFYGSAGNLPAWGKGLVVSSEVWAGGVKEKWTTNNWEQDNPGANFQTNPRVTETNVYDSGGNRRRTTVGYTSFVLPSGASCPLPSDTREYAGDANTVLRHTLIAYRMDPVADADYLSRHIVGLVKEQTLYEGSGTGTPVSRVGFAYDEAGSLLGNDAPVSHDNTFDGNRLTGRGNLSSVKRYDVTVADGSQFTRSMKYNTAGAVVDTGDALAHHTLVSYADSFSDGNNSRNTLAYPKTMTDADGYSTTAIYNFDFGGVTSKQTPLPNTVVNTPGPVQTAAYDAAGRVERVTTATNGAYTRYVYGPNYAQSYATVNNVADEAYSIQLFDGLGRVTGTAANHPGSFGGYSGRHTIYDSLGRAVKQSNPTEVTGAWLPTGDDAYNVQTGQGGWIYTQQTYDWKGRALITKFPSVTNDPNETSTREASYSGCGCAGGEVVTLTDEGTIDEGMPKRRQQKIYSDVLGRTVKTEVFNWQGGTVYATTINNYNSRDQVSSVKQYAGAAASDGSCLSGTCQQSTMTYDGYGRAKTKHTPEQDANTVTTYNYNLDDTTSSIVDARGASQAFAYNARGLVTGISYSAPAGIVPTASVTYAYDAAGNRTSMTDGLGALTYAYDQLSRLTSESRNFTGVGTFPLNYSYNLSGELTSVNDQAFGTTMGYGYDSTGRLSGVTGSGYPNVAQFSSAMQYRAWGGLKGMNYGNGQTLSMGYNSRLLPETYSVPGAISKSYQYYADGRLDYSQDLGDARYDRKNRYDQVGSLNVALSGAEARGLPATDDRPYSQTYEHNAWGDLTNRTGKQWARPEASEPATYHDSRRAGWNYDASGNWLDEGTFNALQRKYDAAGQLIKIEHPAFPNNPKRTDDYDGDGQRLRSGYHQQGCSPEFNCAFEYTYYLRSTVLGGQIVTEIRGNGQKAMGYVYYPNGGVIAAQKLATPEDLAAYVLWRHTDAANLSVRATDPGGSANGFLQGRYNAELDPVGADNALEDPGELQLPDARDDFGPAWLVPSKPMGRCKLDGMPIDCDWAMEMLSSGSAVQCPNNDCGTVQFQFTVYDNEWSGYLPAGIRYSSGGEFVLGSIWTDTGASETMGPGDLGFGSLAMGSAAFFRGGTRTKKRKTRFSTGIVAGDEGNRKNTLTIEHFNDQQESWIRYELKKLVSPNCSAAYEVSQNSLRSPRTIIETGGVVIRHADVLRSSSAADLGLSLEMFRKAQSQAYLGQAQSGIGIDGRRHIFLNTKAFLGPSLAKGYASLSEVLNHEFIHEGLDAWPDPTPVIGSRRHDLAGFPNYDHILEACR